MTVNTQDFIVIPSHRFCVAPMMDWTDRHCRYFLRLISKHAMLYTEMVTSAALLHGDRERFLKFNPAEQPLALQLGGSDPVELAARVVELARSGDMVVCLGAGNITGWAQALPDQISHILSSGGGR